MRLDRADWLLLAYRMAVVVLTILAMEALMRMTKDCDKKGGVVVQRLGWPVFVCVEPR